MPKKETITAAEYDALLDAYIQHNGDITKTADTAGVPYVTAKRYIDEGTENYPAIRPRAEHLRRLALLREDNDRARELHVYRALHQYSLKQIMGQLGESKLELKGRTDVDGKRIIDEKTLRSVVSTVGDLRQLSADVQAMERGDFHREATVNINVNGTGGVDLQVSKPNEELRRFLSDHAHQIAAIEGTGKESEVVAAIVAQPSVPDGATNGNGTGKRKRLRLHRRPRGDRDTASRGRRTVSG